MELHVYVSWCILVLSVWLSVTVSTEVTCENRNCLNNKCSRDGRCLSGCREGCVSDNEGQCLEPSHNCSKCEKGVCTKCQPGYYGPRCMKACDGCRNGSCELMTGQCITGCKDGYYIEPWCNSTRLPADGYTNHQHQKAGLANMQNEEKTRKLYIWIAGAVIVSVILAVVVIIIVAVRGRGKDAKSSYDIPASEHLTAQNEETTEIV